MSVLTASPSVLTPVEMGEVVKVVKAGLEAGRWSPRVYDLLADWCDHVEEALRSGDVVPDAVPMPVPTPAPPAPAAQGPLRGTRRPGVPPPRPPRQSRDGELHCPRHNGGAGAWLPEYQFQLRADRPGKRKSWCQPCTSAYSASKYLSASTLAALYGPGVRVADLPANSPLLQRGCPACQEKWRPTDVIVGGTITPFHKECVSDG